MYEKWWERRVTVGHVMNLLYKHVRHVGDLSEMRRALGACKLIGYHWDASAPCRLCGHPPVPLRGEHESLPPAPNDSHDEESKDE